MKKWFLIIPLLFQVTTWASGPNDGIYEVSFDGTFVFFASIHQNGDQLILLSLADSSLHWEGLSGTQFGEDQFVPHGREIAFRVDAVAIRRHRGVRVTQLYR